MRTLVFSHSRICRDPRLIRQIRWLREAGFTHITTVGFGPRADGVDAHFTVPVLPLALRYFGYLMRNHRSRFRFFFGRFLDAVPEIELLDLHLVVVNEIEYLPWPKLAYGELATVPTYLDLHEDHINHADRGPLEKFAFRKYWNWQLSELCQFVNYRKDKVFITSVEKNIASDYSKIFSADVGLILNAPDSNDLLPLPVGKSTIRLVHHGMGTKGRGIEETIRALRLLDRKFTLDLILFATPQFKLKIEILSRFLGVRRRIKFIAGVPLVQLPAVLNNYDVSIILLSDSIPGHANALPNKFFESIHSKLAVITGPNPSMSKIVTEGDIGISLSSWSYRELAGTVSTLTIEQVQRFKENAAVVAVGLSSDQSRAVFRTLLSKLDYLK